MLAFQNIEDEPLEQVSLKSLLHEEEEMKDEVYSVPQYVITALMLSEVTA